MSTYTRGNVTIRISEDNFSKQAHIQPVGFWTDVISVWQTLDTADFITWLPPEITWSSGGRDGNVSSKEATQNFIEALTYAQEIAAEWKTK